MNADFLSCDWGTTSFRLRQVDGASSHVLQEIREPAGIKSLYESARAAGAMTEVERAAVLARFLRSQLDTLARQSSPAPGLPLVISGMASSSVGWRELPYAAVPFSLDGRGLLAEEIHWDKPAWLGRTYLLSGMASADDMMRGEESEIIGLMNEPAAATLRERALLILPGTHSKHVWIEHAQVVSFRTFMTGELFEVLGRHSILRATIDLEARLGTLPESARGAFEEGVGWVRERGLAAALFRARTRVVLDRRPPPENTWFLSGLLIGAELESLARHAEDRPVILAATTALAELYSLALQKAGPQIHFIQVAPEKMEQATVAAHALFLKNRFAA